MACIQHTDLVYSLIVVVDVADLNYLGREEVCEFTDDDAVTQLILHFRGGWQLHTDACFQPSIEANQQTNDRVRGSYLRASSRWHRYS